MCELCESLKNDFMKMMEELNQEGYELKDLSAPACVGMTWYIMQQMGGHEPPEDVVFFAKREKREPETVEECKGTPYECAEKELRDAAEHAEKYRDSKDKNYKMMALDRLEHANFFIKAARMEARSAEDRKNMQKLRDRVTEIEDYLD